MELIYISPLRYPAEKAGSNFSMKSCEAFAEAGFEVELWAPRRRNPFSGDDPFSFHGVKKNFRLVKLPVLDLAPWRFFYLPMAITFALSVFLYAWYRRARRAIHYSHEEFAIFLLTFLPRFTVYEVHDFPKRNLFFRWLFRRLSIAVTTNHWKKKEIENDFSFPGDRILAVPNAADISLFSIPMEKEEARRILDLSKEKRIVLYAGHLYSWKGVDTLLKAAKYLPDDTLVYFIGGTDADIRKLQTVSYKLQAKNTLIAGWKPHKEIPIWLKAADVLVIPNTAREDISKFYTSPMKLFEYMAAERPIAASDLPSIREVADDDMVWFFEPDNPKSLAQAIQNIRSNPEKAAQKTAEARIKVENFTWEKRANSIKKFIVDAKKCAG